MKASSIALLCLLATACQYPPVETPKPLVPPGEWRYTSKDYLWIGDPFKDAAVNRHIQAIVVERKRETPTAEPQCFLYIVKLNSWKKPDKDLVASVACSDFFPDDDGPTAVRSGE